MGGMNRETLLKQALVDAKAELQRLQQKTNSQRVQLAGYRSMSGHTLILNPKLDLTSRAIMFATNAHAGQKRDYNGQPYILHPLRVASRAAKFGLEDHIVAAAALHDVVEDCAVDVEQLSETFGARVSELVLEVTNEKKEPGLTREMRKRLDRERLAKVSQDAKLIKMIDRIDNLLDLAGAEPEFKIQYAQESDLLMAEALGINGDGRSWVFSVLRVEYITTLNTVLAKAKEELINRTVKG